MNALNLEEWKKDFNFAMSGSKSSLLRISRNMGAGNSFKKMIRGIWSANNAKSRDLYTKGLRTALQDEKALSDGRGLEEVYLTSLEATKSIRRPILAPTTLATGNQVVIWIKDHLYDNQRGVVREIRSTGEYLIEITSKTPPKLGREILNNAKALMWVKLSDVRLFGLRG